MNATAQAARRRTVRDLALYVHVPFCTRRCPYCSFFHVHAGEQTMRRAVDALVAEMDATLGPAHEAPPLRTVFVGGGTPSVLPPDAFDRLLAEIARRVAPATTVEFTVEVNPEDASDDLFDRLARHGVDRVSLGVQSMDAGAQRTLRRCAPEVNLEALRAARRRFERVSADVLLGIPGLDDAAFRRALAILLDEGRPTHVSAYVLEAGGDLSHAARSFLGRVDVDAAAEQYRWVCEHLRERGWDHYEVSNFASGPDQRSRHNVAYWSGRPYVGVGPAAHSFVDGRRWHNVADLRSWLEAVEGGRAARVEDPRDARARGLERAMLAMRQRDGVPRTWCRCDDAVIDELAARGLVRVEPIDGAPGHGASARVRATDAGFLVLDALLVRLDVRPDADA